MCFSRLICLFLCTQGCFHGCSSLSLPLSRQALAAAGAAAGSTPSRLAQASSPALAPCRTLGPAPAPRPPLHGCAGTLLGVLLLEHGIRDASAAPLPAAEAAAAAAAAVAAGRLSPEVAALDAEGAASFNVPASAVCAFVTRSMSSYPWWAARPLQSQGRAPALLSPCSMLKRARSAQPLQI